MKKKVLLPSLALAMLAAWPSVQVVAADDSTSTAIYDFSGFNDQTLIKLFYNAYVDGRNYPTEAEFAAAGIQKSDIAFIRSHVRNKGILDRSGRLIKDTYEKRNLWMNLPMDQGKDSSVGQPSSTFDSDVFSMWNYTNIFGSWNHGFFSAPAAWTDAAHKNGSDIYSGIKFFDTTGGDTSAGADDWMTFLSAKNDDGSFKYVEPIINCLMYFGFDGINYNWEDSGYTDEDVVAFHQALHKSAEKHGFDNFHTGIYTSASSLSSWNVSGLFGDENGRTHDTMLNYASSDFSYNMSSSAKTAINSMGTTDGLYAGVWIVSMNRRWSALNEDEYAKQVGVCLWGEHASSRFWSYNNGDDSYSRQANYQYLLERAMSGGNRNPLDRPAISDTGNEWETTSDGKAPLSTYAGLATWIPERSSVSGYLPFATNFNLGNGDRYAYKGKKTAGSWYNMANQDVVPTYRWLIVNPGTQTVNTDIEASFTHVDQYIGGSSLLLKGKATSAGSDIILYKTNLTVSAGTAFAKVAVKNCLMGVNPSNLYVIVQKADGTWVETPVGDINGTTWEEKQIAIAGLSKGDVIQNIGLRVKGSDDKYTLYVGKLEINDAVKATPANVKDVVVEVKDETKTTLTAKVYWDVDAKAEKRAEWGLVYNDEANIDHFEVLYKNGEDGRVSEIGRTTSWADLISDITFESADDDPFIGVRAVSTDLKTYSPVQWVQVPRADQSTLPSKKDTSYGISEMNPSCDGADIARQQRYVTDVTTTGADQNLDYHTDHPVLDGSQYDDQTDLVLKVKQGQTVTLKLKCFDTSNALYNGVRKTDGLRYCFAGGWIDLNGDHTFNPTDISDDPDNGERLFFLGKIRASSPEFETEGISCTFTVPEDAVTGKSRLRIVFSDAWFAGDFLPTGLHNKGFSMDFSVEISGNNPERPAPVDVHDQGVADEPEGLVADGINNVNGEISKAEVEDGKINFQNADKAWIYSSTGATVNYLANPTSIETATLAKGIYIVKMQKGSIIRSQKIVVK